MVLLQLEMFYDSVSILVYFYKIVIPYKLCKSSLNCLCFFQKYLFLSLNFGSFKIKFLKKVLNIGLFLH